MTVTTLLWFYTAGLKADFRHEWAFIYTFTSIHSARLKIMKLIFGLLLGLSHGQENIQRLEEYVVNHSWRTDDIRSGVNKTRDLFDDSNFTNLTEWELKFIMPIEFWPLMSACWHDQTHFYRLEIQESLFMECWVIGEFKQLNFWKTMKIRFHVAQITNIKPMNLMAYGCQCQIMSESSFGQSKDELDKVCIQWHQCRKCVSIDQEQGSM